MAFSIHSKFCAFIHDSSGKISPNLVVVGLLALLVYSCASGCTGNGIDDLTGSMDYVFVTVYEEFGEEGNPENEISENMDKFQGMLIVPDKSGVDDFVPVAKCAVERDSEGNISSIDYCGEKMGLNQFLDDGGKIYTEKELKDVVMVEGMSNRNLADLILRDSDNPYAFNLILSDTYKGADGTIWEINNLLDPDGTTEINPKDSKTQVDATIIEGKDGKYWLAVFTDDPEGIEIRKRREASPGWSSGASDVFGLPSKADDNFELTEGLYMWYEGILCYIYPLSLDSSLGYYSFEVQGSDKEHTDLIMIQRSISQSNDG